MCRRPLEEKRTLHPSRVGENAEFELVSRLGSIHVGAQRLPTGTVSRQWVDRMPSKPGHLMRRRTESILQQVRRLERATPRPDGPLRK